MEDFHDVFKHHRDPHVQEVLDYSHPYLPQEGSLGEMVLSTGGAIYLYHQGADGIVDISPFTCMNGIVTEAVYPRVSREHDNIPIRVFYFDGTASDLDRDVGIFLELAKTYKRRKKIARRADKTMFARLGSFAVRFRWFIIAAWILAAAVLTLVAPNIDDVAVSDQRAFLPASSPSLDANQLLEKYFPDQVSPSSAVVVVDAGEGGRAGAGAAAEFISGLTAWLTGPDKPAGVDNVWSPAIGDEQTKAGLVSPDGRVALVLTRFTAMGTTETTKDAIAAVHERLGQAPAGVSVYLTGDGPILAAYNEQSQKSMDSTTWITILLVVAILLIIYRSPVSPIIPLLTIGLAYVISRAVVAFLGSGLLTISMYTNVFLIVVLFGAGTDYCLFLISRFREEMTEESSAAPAVRTTVRTIGETIASSAGTVIVGLATMAAAELGLYNTTGPSIAIGVAIALAGGAHLHSCPPHGPRPLRILAAQAQAYRRARAVARAGRARWWGGRSWRSSCRW